VFAWKALRLRVDILCYSALYLNYKHLYMNTTAVEIRLPFRSLYGTERVFAASLVNGYGITLPFNQPKRLAGIRNPITRKTETPLPGQLISFANNPRGAWDPAVRHRASKGRNVWVPSSRYWGSRRRINLPYLPYFSNCRGYGNYIPLWALIEQHQRCEHVP
jgi:hypothetical protein